MIIIIIIMIIIIVTLITHMIIAITLTLTLTLPLTIYIYIYIYIYMYTNSNSTCRRAPFDSRLSHSETMFKSHDNYIVGNLFSRLKWVASGRGGCQRKLLLPNIQCHVLRTFVREQQHIFITTCFSVGLPPHVLDPHHALSETSNISLL